MSRKTVRLTVDHLAELGDPVRSCLFWELGAVDRARLDEAERIAEKERWVSTVLREWGSCGRVVRVDGRTVGHIVYAPAAWLPGAAALPTAPGSPDAIIAATDYVRVFADQIRTWVPGRYRVLGTDGFGRSDYRRKLRHFFEVDRHHIVVAALQVLADDARAAEAIDRYGIDADAAAPWGR